PIPPSQARRPIPLSPRLRAHRPLRAPQSHSATGRRARQTHRRRSAALGPADPAAPGIRDAIMTPDMHYSLAVAIVGSILSLLLPTRYAIVPLAISIILYPSTLLVPPKEMSLTAQRYIAMILILRCIVQGSIRRQFKWRWADTAAMIYFALITISMLLALPK